MATTLKGQKVAVVGSGLIGRCWAMMFAAAGYEVQLHDVEIKFLSAAMGHIRKQLEELKNIGLARGTLSVDEQYSLIKPEEDLAKCLAEVIYIQECVPENLELKHKLYAQLDQLVGDQTVIGSSTSYIPASKLSENMKRKSQVIVAHPVNPPFLIPLVEVVLSPSTADWVKDRTLALMKEIGQSPVLLKKELNGFALNRVQVAVVAECWRLVMDGAIDVEDVDKIMRDGLGLRYAFLGPMEVCHLNANGIKDYFQRYGPSMCSVANSFGPVPNFDVEGAERLAATMDKVVPVGSIPERQAWRDNRLAELALLKKKL